MASVVHIPLLLFYPNITTATIKVNTSHHDQAMAMNERCQHLIQTLAKAVTHFYPLAGRLTVGNATIECNDDGAEFVNARVNGSLSEVLDVEMLNQFLPTETESKLAVAAGAGPLLLVQVNMFECGGMVIGFRISHKIADGSTVCTFVKCLATTALQSPDSDQALALPEFGAASLFPPLDFSNSSQPAPSKKFVKAQKCIRRRYVFDASKIYTLQSNVASSVVPKPTRVEAVLALIWKCAMEASRSNLGMSLRPSALRKRVTPLLPENLAGNVVGFFTSRAEESLIDVKDLAAKIRKGSEQVKEKYAAKVGFDSKEACQELKDYYRNLMDNYTSWCRFTFYETDFGWGKPAWMSFVSFPIKNFIVLMDKRDGNGI